MTFDPNYPYGKCSFSAILLEHPGRLRKVGHHRCMGDSNANISILRYYDTTICIVDWRTKEFGTNPHYSRSTRTACGRYRSVLSRMGAFKEVDFDTLAKRHNVEVNWKMRTLL